MESPLTAIMHDAALIVRQRRPKWLILLLSGCDLNPLSSSPPPGVPAVTMPPRWRPEDIVGRWGMAAYHRDQDRARTIVEARDQCAQPFLIDRSPGGNILVLGHDSRGPAQAACRDMSAPGES